MGRCSLCQKEIDGTEGIHCGRCDKIVGDVNADLVAEFDQEVNMV